MWQCLLQPEEGTHRWGVCVSVCSRVVGDSNQGQCSASSEAGRYTSACLGRPPPRQSHFPRVAVTHGAPSPTVYVTVAVKGIMAGHLTFLLGGGGVRAAGYIWTFILRMNCSTS